MAAELITDTCDLSVALRTSRNPAARRRYLRAALSQIPRLLGAIDRNPYRATYGCLDRQFWHYRTSAFPSEMYQEGVLPLAQVATMRLPGNRWYGQPRVRELAEAALRYCASSGRRDGSCDDYYPFERALGAAAFSFAAAVEAYHLLRMSDAQIMGWLRRRAAWLMRHDESGRLANHQALVALGLTRLAALTGEADYATAAQARIERVLAWQSPEGWFEEYGGADPGYQTVTIDCLAKYARLVTGWTRERGIRRSPSLALRASVADERLITSPTRERGIGSSPSLTLRVSTSALRESIAKAVAFARLFLHPDGSYSGPYGSRGTYHFYPHGMELLATDDPNAADVADGFLLALRTGRHGYFDDDRMYAHRLGNLIEAYRDWSPRRLPPESSADGAIRYLPEAGLLVYRAGARHTVISAARGGIFKHFAAGCEPITDAGLIVELDDGRVAVSQRHQTQHQAQASGEDRNQRDVRFDQSDGHATLQVSVPLDFVRFETATPLKQALFHVGMCTVGRFCRTAVRKLLQRRLITGQRPAPLRLTRRFELWSGTPGHSSPRPSPQRGEREEEPGPRGGVARPEHGRDGRGVAALPRLCDPCSGPATLRVVDTIELTCPSVAAGRMAFGTDHEAAYVAASGVYQESVLEPWTDLSRHLRELNEQRRVTIVREW